MQPYFYTLFVCPFRLIDIPYLRAMYLYNVTVIVADSVRETVLARIESTLATLQDHTHLSLLELMDSPHEGTTYCMQLQTDDLDRITAFRDRDLAAFQLALNSDFPEQVFFFDSTMKYLQTSDV